MNIIRIKKDEKAIFLIHGTLQSNATDSLAGLLGRQWQENNTALAFLSVPENSELLIIEPTEPPGDEVKE